jgi:hypothetical protein
MVEVCQPYTTQEAQTTKQDDVSQRQLIAEKV